MKKWIFRHGLTITCMVVFLLLVLGAITKYKEPIKAHSERSASIKEFYNKEYSHVEINKKDGEISQTFSITDPAVTGIGIRFWHSESIQLNSVINVRLQDEHDNTVYAWDIPGSALNGSQNNDDIVEYSCYFKDEDVGTMLGSYKLVIYTESLYEETGINVCLAEEDTYPEGGATVNGKQMQEDIHFSFRGQKYLFIRPLYLGLMAVLLLCFIGLAVWLHLRTPRIEVLFLCLSLLFGTVILLALPPYSVPDESRHVNTSYYYSSLLMGKDAVDEEGRTLIRLDDTKYTQHEMYPSIVSYKRFFGQFFQMDHSEGKTALLVSNELKPLNIPAIAYLPQIIGITLARILGLGNVLLLVLGRWFGLLFYSLAIYLAIKIAPAFKRMFFIVGLMPICLELGASFSYDCTILGLSFLFIAYAMNMIYRKKPTWKDWVILSIVMAWLAPIKVVYILIGAMLIFVPKGETKKQKMGVWLGILCVLAAGAIAIVITRLEAISTMTGAAHLDEAGGLQYYTLGTILQNPARFVGVLFNTFYYEADFYLEGMIGGYLGWLDIRVQEFILVGFGILIWMALIPTKENDSLTLPLAHRLVYILIFVAVVGMVMMALTFNFTPNQDLLIRGVQGRYFLPAVPLAILAMQPVRISREKNFSVQLYGISAYVLLFFTCLKIVITVVAR